MEYWLPIHGNGGGSTFFIREQENDIDEFDFLACRADPDQFTLFVLFVKSLLEEFPCPILGSCVLYKDCVYDLNCGNMGRLSALFF